VRVWVPIGINVGLVAVAALARDGDALGLTGAAAAVTIVAIVVHARAAAADQERIQYLQAALPRLTTALDAEGVLSLAPKPSVVMGEVLRQQKPAVSQGAATPISIPPVGDRAATEPIDRG
jgi:hypothetical protein